MTSLSARLYALEAASFGAWQRARGAARRDRWLCGAHAFKLLDPLLESDDLGPQAVAFVGELSDTFKQSVVVGGGSGSVGGIDEACVALTLSGAVHAHSFRVRRPLARPAHSSRTGHRMEMVGA